eukprot:gene20026-26002_t
MQRCKWTSNSGSSYDLTYLTRSSNQLSYVIIDGDIPCTPETEPSYAYTWNFCQDVTSKSIDRAYDSYDCYVIGNYNPLKDDLYYSQLDLNDPSKGISMRYPSGDRCEIADESGVLLNVSRSATIDVICDNVKEIIVEAQESSTCQYHLVMKSYYGCPTTCAMTSNGLCNSHDIPCQWQSLSGASYDLTPLTKYSDISYTIKDGDIPCTPETEPSFGYSFNFCRDVTKESVNTACSLLRKSGVALQYVYLNENDYDCYVIGNYDPTQDDLYYSLLDNSDPSKGVSMKYPAGDRCELKDGTRLYRSATIDVICDNVDSVIVEAQEPSICQYHLVMRSYHGCPTTCPITSNGLCDSHGLCMYDSKKSQSYCYCNNGFYGDDCSATKLRKEQANYSNLPSGTEMVETVNFQ